MTAYLILTLGSLAFWSLYQMAPSGLMLFAVHNVNLFIGSVEIQPQWIQNINTVCIVVGGPMLAAWFTRMRARGWRIDIPQQFATSLLLMAVGFLILPLGIKLAGVDGRSAFVWLFMSYVLQSIGELLISPIGYAMIGKLAPKQYQGVMMGSWMLVTGLASLFAGDFSGMIPEPKGTTAVATNPEYAKLFGALGVGALVVGIALVVLIPFLRKLITDKAEMPPEDMAMTTVVPRRLNSEAGIEATDEHGLSRIGSQILPHPCLIRVNPWPKKSLAESGRADHRRLSRQDRVHGGADVNQVVSRNGSPSGSAPRRRSGSSVPARMTASMRSSVRIRSMMSRIAVRRRGLELVLEQFADVFLVDEGLLGLARRDQLEAGAREDFRIKTRAHGEAGAEQAEAFEAETARVLARRLHDAEHGTDARRWTSSKTRCGVLAAMSAISAPARARRSTEAEM